MGRSVALLFALALVRTASATEAQQVSPSGEEVQVFDVREFTTPACAISIPSCASWRAAIHPSQPATAVPQQCQPGRASQCRCLASSASQSAAVVLAVPAKVLLWQQCQQCQQCQPKCQPSAADRVRGPACSMLEVVTTIPLCRYLTQLLPDADWRRCFQLWLIRNQLPSQPAHGGRRQLRDESGKQRRSAERCAAHTG